MTGTPTWEQPYQGSSYEITDYLTTQHHWKVSVDGGPWSEQRGINDPSLVALPVVAVPEPTPEPEVPKICDLNTTSPIGKAILHPSGQLELPYVKWENQVLSVKMVLQSLIPSIILNVVDFCVYPHAIAENPEPAILSSKDMMLNIPAVLVDTDTYVVTLQIESSQNSVSFKVVDLQEVIQEVPLVALKSDSFRINVFGNMLEVKLVQDTSIDQSYPYYWRLEKAVEDHFLIMFDVVLQENQDLAFFSNLIIRGKPTQGTLERYYDPNDPKAFIWKYVECPHLPTYRIFFQTGDGIARTPNPSCRQKRDMHIFVKSVLPGLIRHANKFRGSVDIYNETAESLELLDDLDKYLTAFSLGYGLGTAQPSSALGSIAISQFAKDMNVVLGDSDWSSAITSGLATSAGQILSAPSCLADAVRLDPIPCTILIGSIGINVGRAFTALSGIVKDLISFNDLKARGIDGAINFLTAYYMYGGNLRNMANDLGVEIKSVDSEGKPTPDIINWLMLKTAKGNFPSPKDTFPTPYALKFINRAMSRIDIENPSRFEDVVPILGNPDKESTSHRFIVD